MAGSHNQTEAFRKIVKFFTMFNVSSIVNVFRLPVAYMLGDDVAVGNDPYAIERADGDNFTMRVLCRHAVVVPIESDQRQAVGLRVLDTPRLETVIRNSEHRLAIFFEQCRLRAGLAA